MCYTGLVKRIIPFAITFAVGLFIASFFVAITFPGLRWREGRRFNRFQEMQQLRIENAELREKTRRLETENEELRHNSTNWDALGEAPLVPPVDFEAHHPPPPPPPKRPKNPRFE